MRPDDCHVLSWKAIGSDSSRRRLHLTASHVSLIFCPVGRPTTADASSDGTTRVIHRQQFQFLDLDAPCRPVAPSCRVALMTGYVTCSVEQRQNLKKVSQSNYRACKVFGVISTHSVFLLLFSFGMCLA